MAARKTAIEYYSDLASRWPRGSGRAPTNNELEQAFALLYELNPNKRPRGPRGGSAEALAVAGYLGGVWNPLELGRAIAQATGGGVNEWLNIIERPPPEGMDGLDLFTLHDNKQRGAQRKLSIALTPKGRRVVEKYCAAEGIDYFLQHFPVNLNRKGFTAIHR